MPTSQRPDRHFSSQCPSAADAKISRQAAASAIQESKNQCTVMPSQPLGVRNRNCPYENANVTAAYAAKRIAASQP
ncbi:MAG: hypothetical protein ABSB74_09730 [Tepidisphaeraceae bacterium]